MPFGHLVIEHPPRYVGSWTLSVCLRHRRGENGILYGMLHSISSQAGLSDLAALFALPSTLALESMTFDDQIITLHVVATAATAACPGCGTPGTRIHSRYSRTLRDGVCCHG